MFILTEQDLKKRDGIFEAESEEMLLWEFPRKAKNNWRSFYLRLKNPVKNIHLKRAWWFGCNGKRLSRCRDSNLLLEHQPEVYKWVRGVLYDC